MKEIMKRNYENESLSAVDENLKRHDENQKKEGKEKGVVRQLLGGRPAFGRGAQGEPG